MYLSGDIGNITMQEVPQNHFIPLPEILCLIILDLNNKQILATVDIIQAQLKKCYQGTQLPSNQLVYETLHSLIQERKIFHTGTSNFFSFMIFFFLFSEKQLFVCWYWWSCWPLLFKLSFHNCQISTTLTE